MTGAPKVGFIGIGAQKCATSWLHHVLAQHPAIFASEPKELNYFTANYDRGALWYEAQFAAAPPGATCGEASPTYFFSADAPSRAFGYNPALRLIAVLRDPVARAFSNHLHEIRKGHIPETVPFETALAANPAYVEQGRYAANLGRWLAAFPREALLVLIAEELQDDPAAAYEAVCRHLGVAPGAAPAGLRERRHESVASHLPRLQRGLRLAGDAARGLGLGRVVAAVKGAPGIRSGLALNRKDLREAVPKMQPETRAGLVGTFRDDVAFVSRLLGRPVPAWSAWPEAAPRPAGGRRHAG